MAKPNMGMAGGNRNLFGNAHGGAGKGSTERGGEWRKHLDGVSFPGVAGMVRVGSKLVKRYGVAAPVKHSTAPHAVVR